MSVKQMGIVWGLDLAPNHKIVLLALADHADDDGGNVYPSVERIAWKTGYVGRQVQNILRSLRDTGLIERVGNTEGGRGHVVRYQLHLEKGVNLSPFVPMSQRKGAKSDTERVQSSTLKDELQFLQTIIEPSVEPSVSKENSRSLAPIAFAQAQMREANPTWDAVGALCGKPMTKNERSDFGMTVSQLIAVDATPEEISGFGPWWHQHYNTRLSHHCLRDHWGAYLTAPVRQPQLTDIKSSSMRTLLAMKPEDFDDDTTRHLPAQNGRPRSLNAHPRRLGPGDQAPQPDVLHPPARSQP